MIIDCIGCLHGAKPKLKGGDLLIITGDITACDTIEEIDEFDKWLEHQKYKKKIFIAGNHDNKLVKEGPRKYNINYTNACIEKFEYLCDSGTEFQGLKIWGSPWTASFEGINSKCKAFTIPFDSETEERLMDKWDMIPTDTHILITHSPAFGVLDGIPNEDGSLFHVGSTSLHGWLKNIGKPRLHVFSHIHEARGKEVHFPQVQSVNCSIMNRQYKPVNKPIRVIL